MIRHLKRSHLRTAAGVAGFSILALLAGSMQARAGHSNQHGKHHGHAKVQKHRGHGPAFHPSFGHRPYYAGRVYDRSHHHQHMVYRFPVRTEFGVSYRSASYCGSRLAVSGSFPIGDARIGFSYGR